MKKIPIKTSVKVAKRKWIIKLLVFLCWLTAQKKELRRKIMPHYPTRITVMIWLLFVALRREDGKKKSKGSFHWMVANIMATTLTLLISIKHESGWDSKRWSGRSETEIPTSLSAVTNNRRRENTTTITMFLSKWMDCTERVNKKKRENFHFNWKISGHLIIFNFSSFIFFSDCFVLFFFCKTFRWTRFVLLHFFSFSLYVLSCSLFFSVER